MENQGSTPAPQPGSGKEWTQPRTLPHLEVLVHASYCTSADCTDSNCRKMRRVLEHTKRCKKTALGTCVICRQLIALCCRHVKVCTTMPCAVPFCHMLKIKLREQRQQQQRQRLALQQKAQQTLQQMGQQQQPQALQQMGQQQQQQALQQMGQQPMQLQLQAVQQKGQQTVQLQLQLQPMQLQQQPLQQQQQAPLQKATSTISAPKASDES